MIKVCVRWFDSYYEEFECTEVRAGNAYLWMRLADGRNRQIPLIQVRWFSQTPESHSKVESEEVKADKEGAEDAEEMDKDEKTNSIKMVRSEDGRSRIMAHGSCGKSSSEAFDHWIHSDEVVTLEEEGRSRGMSNEEAIKYLEKADVTVYQEPKTKTAEALEMAIEALKADRCYLGSPCEYQNEDIKMLNPHPPVQYIAAINISENDMEEIVKKAAQRLKDSEWHPNNVVEDTCKNIGEGLAECDQFVCSACGIELQDWHRVERDMDDGEASYHEYTFRFCPNCGRKIVEGAEK